MNPELMKKHLAGDFTAEDCTVRFFPIDAHRLLVEWRVEHVGFGQLYLQFDLNGALCCLDSEMMGKPFIKALLNAAVDGAELR